MKLRELGDKYTYKFTGVDRALSFLLAQFILKVISINIGRRRKEYKCNKSSFRKGIKRAPAREIFLLKVIIIPTFIL